MNVEPLFIDTKIPQKCLIYYDLRYHPLFSLDTQNLFGILGFYCKCSNSMQLLYDINELKTRKDFIDLMYCSEYLKARNLPILYECDFLPELFESMKMSIQVDLIYYLKDKLYIYSFEHSKFIPVFREDIK